MAESTNPHRDSDFFCPSIVEFLAENDGNEDGELDELLANLPPLIELEGEAVPPHTPMSPPPTSSTHSTISLTGNAVELQRLKDKTKNANTEKSTGNWARRFQK